MFKNIAYIHTHNKVNGYLQPIVYLSQTYICSLVKSDKQKKEAGLEDEDQGEDWKAGQAQAPPYPKNYIDEANIPACEMYVGCLYEFLGDTVTFMMVSKQTGL